MARHPSSFAKRQRELARQRKRQEKERRRSEKKTEGPADTSGEDRDVAGIVPGPQAQPWMDYGVDDVAGVIVEVPAEDDADGAADSTGSANSAAD